MKLRLQEHEYCFPVKLQYLEQESYSLWPYGVAGRELILGDLQNSSLTV